MMVKILINIYLFYIYNNFKLKKIIILKMDREFTHLKCIFSLDSIKHSHKDNCVKVVNNIKKNYDELCWQKNELKHEIYNNKKKYNNENSLLKDENSLLKDENSLLKDENSLLKDENSLLKDENISLKNEIKINNIHYEFKLAHLNDFKNNIDINSLIIFNTKYSNKKRRLNY